MNDHDSAYAGLVDDENDGQWAFGTGFDDPLDGIDTTVPASVDRRDLSVYCLMLGDDALIAAQRLCEWSTNAPELEEEVALANIGIDFLGQARLLLSRAANADPDLVPLLPADSHIPPDDALAFFRDEGEFRCARIVELPNGDFASSVFRLLAFATYRLALMERLCESADPVLAAIAGKSVKELTYHRDYAARWTATLAQGTEKSRRHILAGIADVWPYVRELFETHPVEVRLERCGAAVRSGSLRSAFDAVVGEVFSAGSLDVPADPTTESTYAARDGRHTAALKSILAEMQSVAREHPSGRW